MGYDLDQPRETEMHVKNALHRPSIQFAARRLRHLVGLISVVGVLGLAVACTSNPEANSSNQQISAAVNRPLEGVEAGPTGTSQMGPGARRGLDDQELQRLRDAVRQAFAATTDVTTAYTVVPKNIDAEPTVVAATPAGPKEIRAEGSTCRPITLAVTKETRTTTGVLTFCQTPGSPDLKPAGSR